MKILEKMTENPLECLKYMEEDIGWGHRSKIKRSIENLISLIMTVPLLLATLLFMAYRSYIWGILGVVFLISGIFSFYFFFNISKKARVICTEEVKKMLPDFDYMSDFDCMVLTKTIDKVEQEDYLGEIRDLIAARYIEIKENQKKKIDEVNKILNKDEIA